LELSNSDDPGKLGLPKKGRWSGYYAYDLGRSHRLIYKVLYKEKIILIVAVGDHRQVYGKD
jgi:addiction module RelE/StbE family toxin